MTTHADPGSLLKLAESTAREAGRLLRTSSAGLRAVEATDGKDVKLRADRASEELIRKRLATTGLPIIGEEEGGDASLTRQDQPYWCIDPLDGTHNYLRDNPLCCVSIGLLRGVEPVLGVIYDFNAEEVFAGIVGQGATLNGREIRPEFAPSIDTASLQTGFPTGRGYDDASLLESVRLIQRFQKVRMLGSAAMALAWLAVGRLDAYREESIRLWDIAAGLALVKAVGGTVRMEPASHGAFLAYDVWAAGRDEFIPAEGS